MSTPAPRPRRGNYSLMMGSMIAVVVGFGALSVDVSLITLSDLQAQFTADAASHAALIAFEEQLDQNAGNVAADFVADKNKVGMGYAKLDGPPEFGQWDYDLRAFDPGVDANGFANAVRVKVSRSEANDNAVELFLAPLLGVPTADVEATSIAAMEMRALVSVVDMSCSMMDGGWSSTYVGSAVYYSRLANIAFVDYLYEHPQVGDRFGLALFAARGTLEQGNGAPWGTIQQDAVPWLGVTLMDGEQSTVYGAVDGICSTMTSVECSNPPVAHPDRFDIGDCTNPAIGLQQATNELLRSSNETYFRGIVLMSDGLPNDIGYNSCNNYAEALANAITASDNAWANDIHVWTILYHNGSFDAQFMKDLVQGVGFFQSSPNESDLEHMYEQVARSLPTAFVE